MKPAVKSAAIAAAVIICLIVSVMGIHWSETADRAFWYKMWPVASFLAGVALLAGWLWMKSKEKAKK